MVSSLATSNILLSCSMLRTLLFCLVFTLLLPFASRAQTYTLSGTVTDAENKTALPGVNLVVKGTNLGTTTDANGRYQLALSAGNYLLTFSYVGYAQQEVRVTMSANQQLNIQLAPVSGLLEQVVVTAGRFEQKVSEVTVSMEVIKPDLLQQNNLQRFDDALERVPGVSVVNGQLNIRGTSGFSYGAGSRVQVLVDDMPLLSADAGDVKWSYLPIENLSQVEVIKGAASALFGSSALGGIVNLRTAYPGAKPTTKVQLFSQVYDRPRSFFEAPYTLADFRHQSGFSALHSRQIGKHDLTLGTFATWDEGYRIGDYSKRIRGNVNWRYRITERLHVALNANGMVDSAGNFFFWKNDTAAYFPSPGTNDAQLGIRYNIDPVLTYYGAGDRKHVFRNRLYVTENRGDSTRNTKGQALFNEYQYQQPLPLKWAKKTILTAGLVHLYNFVNSGPLYGIKDSRNVAVYVQADQNIGKFNYSVGLRYESFVINREAPIQYPVARLGVNYQLFKASWLRASFGQGFRTPSVAERYVNAAAGAINVIPNPTLGSERGWSAEFGMRQGFKLGELQGMVDVAGFWTSYRDMIEFTFAFFPEGVGFKALNLSQYTSLIRGVEVSGGLQGKWNRYQIASQWGYTYISPIQREVLDADNRIFLDNPLKYRTRHLVRADVEVRRARWGVGTNIRYNSFMESIDRAFEVLIPGVVDFRQRRDAGDFIADFRLSYELNSDLRLSLLVRNAFNRDFMVVPGNIGAPRNFGFQLLYQPQ